MHRRAVSCSLCGGQYFPKSLPHHQKSCAKKHGVSLTPCPHCNTQMPAQDLKWHFQRCDKAPKPKAGEKAIPKISIPPVDARHACHYCGRKFSPDRIEKHTGICAKTSLSKRPVYDSYSHRHVDGLSKHVATKLPAKSRVTSNKPRKRLKKSIVAASHTIEVNAPTTTDSEVYASAKSAMSNLPSHKNRKADLFSAGSSADDTHDSQNYSPESPPAETPVWHSCVSGRNDEALLAPLKIKGRREAKVDKKQRSRGQEVEDSPKYISFADGGTSAGRSASKAGLRMASPGDTSLEEEDYYAARSEEKKRRGAKASVNPKRSSKAPPTVRDSSPESPHRSKRSSTRRRTSDDEWDDSQQPQRYGRERSRRRHDSLESQSSDKMVHERAEHSRTDRRVDESRQRPRQSSKSQHTHRRRGLSTDSVDSSTAPRRDRRTDSVDSSTAPRRYRRTDSVDSSTAPRRDRRTDSVDSSTAPRRDRRTDSVDSSTAPRRDRRTDSVDSSTAPRRDRRTAASHHGGNEGSNAAYRRPPRHDAPRHEAMRHTPPRHEAMRHDVTRHEAPRHDAHRHYSHHHARDFDYEPSEESYYPSRKAHRSVHDADQSYKPSVRTAHEVPAHYSAGSRAVNAPTKPRSSSNKTKSTGFEADWGGAGGVAGAPSGGGRLGSRNMKQTNSSGGGFLPTNDTSSNNPLVSDALLAVYAKHHNENMATR